MTKNKKVIKATYSHSVYMNVELNINNDQTVMSVLSNKLNNEESAYIDNYLNYECHYENLGRLLESAENILRVQLELIQINRIKTIVYSLKLGNESSQNCLLVADLIKDHGLSSVSGVSSNYNSNYQSNYQSNSGKDKEKESNLRIS